MGNTISSNTIGKIYYKVVFWHKNLFLLPSGFCGKNYIEEITKLLHEWIHGSPLNEISVKANMLMPDLLLQKLSKYSKSKDHHFALDAAWNYSTKGNLKNYTVKTKLFKYL